MFISDHETATDLLYNEVISKTVVRLIQDTGDRPISIGVHGDWGAGKSSILAMAQHSLEKEANVVCVWFNGWQFQGFENAKTVLIERILATLEENKTVLHKAKDELGRLIRRVKWFKAAKHAGGLAATLATGNPLYSMAAMATDYLHAKASDPSSVVDDAEKAKEVLGETEAHSMPKEMEAFHHDFKSLLAKAGITRLVVLLDDLDRCLPNTAIETLEAIKLFLFVPRAAFVIAADEAMIEYAVRQHFPDLPLGSGPLTYARNYLEKLIQVPFRIPAMGTAETSVYIALLDLEATLTSEHEHFKKLRDIAREVLRKPWESQLFERSELRRKFDAEKLPEAVDHAVTLSDQLAPMLAEQTKGNPRQVKRFLNALLLRHEIAKARGFADEIKTSVLAKIMLVERFFGKFYDALATEVAASHEGTVPFLKSWEAKDAADEGKRTKEKNALDEWAEIDAIREWAHTDPPLADEDLRPYILITRDRRNPFAAASSENAVLVERMLSEKIIVAGMSKEIKAFKPDLAAGLFDEISARIRAKEEYTEMPPGTAGLAELAKAHPVLQQRLLDFAAELPTRKLGSWILGEAGWHASLSGALQPKWQELLARWGEQSENRGLQKGARALQSIKKPS